VKELTVAASAGATVAEAPAVGPEGDLVDIVSGSFGAGHDAAAAAIAAQFRSRGYRTRIFDIVDLMPGPLGRGLRAAFLRQVQLAPSSYRWMADYAHQRDSINVRIAQGMACAHQGLMEMASDGARAIISTHPLASQALGELRARGRLAVPVTTYLTDMSVHRLLVHRSIDLHVALHELPAAQARRLGAAMTRVIEPAVPTDFRSASSLSQTDCRRALGLPLDRRLVLVTGGSCGIGRLAQSARDIADTGIATPVVLCARNERLRRQLRSRSSAVALGWVDKMPLLLRAVDAVVQNSGGFTSLQALAAGRPIVTYRCLPGHGRANAAALDRAGLVAWLKSRADLKSGLAAALERPRAGSWPEAQASLPTVVDAVLTGSLARSR
jgi:processive 1,2-diacylglycerol beta-glucosyltransferase